jgi:hypothetical protein
LGCARLGRCSPSDNPGWLGDASRSHEQGVESSLAALRTDYGSCSSAGFSSLLPRWCMGPQGLCLSVISLERLGHADHDTRLGAFEVPGFSFYTSPAGTFRLRPARHSRFPSFDRQHLRTAGCAHLLRQKLTCCAAFRRNGEFRSRSAAVRFPLVYGSCAPMDFQRLLNM